MLRKPPVQTPARTPSLLRRSDQATVAVLVVAALAATIGWWIAHGGWRGDLIELERAQSQTAVFQVDPNSAEWPELVQLPGVGPTLAKRIVESRRTDGAFLAPEDLLRVRGIGARILDRIRPHLLPMPGQHAAADSSGALQVPLERRQ